MWTRSRRDPESQFSSEVQNPTALYPISPLWLRNYLHSSQFGSYFRVLSWLPLVTQTPDTLSPLQPEFPFWFFPQLRTRALFRQQIKFIWQSNFEPKKAQSAPWGKCLPNQSPWSWMAGSVTSQSAFLDPQRGTSALSLNLQDLFFQRKRTQIREKSGSQPMSQWNSPREEQTFRRYPGIHCADLLQKAPCIIFLLLLLLFM